MISNQLIYNIRFTKFYILGFIASKFWVLCKIGTLFLQISTSFLWFTENEKTMFQNRTNNNHGKLSCKTT